MNNTQEDIDKIKELSKNKGVPILEINYSKTGKSVSFVHGGRKVIAYWYSNITKAIQRELRRLV